MDRDWSNLPAKSIQLISKKILFKEQYAQIRLVCKKWAQFCPPNPGQLIGQVPWLWLPQDPASCTLSFYDILYDKTYNFYFPKVTNKEIFSVSSRGWVLIERDLELSLFNPIKRELKRNCLPSLGSTATILGFGQRSSYLGFGLRLGFEQQHLYRMILTESPCNEGCVVVAEFQCSEWELGFCRVGDKSWTILKLRDEIQMADFKYKDGLVYAMNDIGQITIYDIRNLSRKILTLSKKILGDLCSLPSFDALYLVLGEGEFDGIILALRQSCHVETEEFEVYKCVKTRGRYKWKRERNIGNAILILDCTKCEIVSLDSVRLNGWEANHVLHHKIKFSHDRSYHNVVIQMTSIENGYVKEVPNSLGAFYAHGFAWFTPALR